jgi:hypothetical protein
MQDTGCVPRVRVFRRQVPGTGYRLSGTWDLVPGTGAESTPRAGYRGPSPTRTPGMHPVSCRLIMRDLKSAIASGRVSGDESPWSVFSFSERRMPPSGSWKS